MSSTAPIAARSRSRPARAPYDVLRERDDGARERVGLVKVLRDNRTNLRLQDVEFGARLFERDAGTQPGNRLIIVIAHPSRVRPQRDEPLDRLILALIR